MTNLNNVNREGLIAIAQGFGLPAQNMDDATLRTVLAQMMGQNVAQPQVEGTARPAQQVAHSVDPFASVMQQTAPQAEYMPTTKGYVSPKLLKFCVDLHKRFNLDVRTLEGADYAQIRRITDELSSRPMPASVKQIEIIKSTIAELNELGVEIAITEQIIDNLTGGAEGTASQVIDMLFRKRTEAQANGPLSDKQAETLVKWFYCPDIPWENFEVVQKVAMPIEGNPSAWRFMTPEEFTAELKAKISKSNASKFIDDHQHLYYEWSKTRISQYQIDTIRQLEERMANMHSVGVAEFAIVDGVVTQVYKKPKRDYAPQGYQPMTEHEIKQLSSTDASKLITQMQWESKNREKSAVNVDDHAQQELEDKVQSFGKNELHAVNLEHQNLIDVIFKLEATIGQENEELHESINELMIQRKGNSVDVGNTIMEFMLDAMDTKLLTFSTLVSITQNSTIASRIVEMIDPAQYDRVLHGDSNKVDNSSVVETQAVQNEVQNFLNTLK
jgi:hypothetical protein